MTVLIVSADAGFAGTIADILQGWGMGVSLADGELKAEGIAEVVLLDIRHEGEKALSQLLVIFAQHPAAEIILINRPDNIGPSIAGMQAGAADELIAPFDTGSLKKKIAEAVKRQKKKKGKRSIFERFGDAMAAATFAQAGEFETAVDLFDGSETGKSSGTKQGKEEKSQLHTKV